MANLKFLGIKSNYIAFQIKLTASMKRSLTDEELESIGEPSECGVLPVRPKRSNFINVVKTVEFKNELIAEVYNP